MGSVRVSATPPLPGGTLRRLRQWATTFSASLHSDDPPLIGLAFIDEGEDAGLEGASLWASLRRIVGPAYAVVRFSEQRHSDLHAGSGQPCRPGTTGS